MLTSSTQRIRQARISEALGHREVREAPDRRPAIRLRCELARDRRLGIPWSDALFAEEVEYVLRSSPAKERKTWRSAFFATRDQWRLGYAFEDDPCAAFGLGSLLAA